MTQSFSPFVLWTSVSASCWPNAVRCWRAREPGLVDYQGQCPEVTEGGTGVGEGCRMIREQWTHSLPFFVYHTKGWNNTKLRAGIGRSRRKGGSWFCCCCFGHSKHSKSFVRPVKSISSYEHVVIKMKMQKTPQWNGGLLVPSPFLERSDSGWGVYVAGKRETWSVAEIIFQMFSCLQVVTYSWDAVKAWSSLTQGKQFISWTSKRQILLKLSLWRW